MKGLGNGSRGLWKPFKGGREGKRLTQDESHDEDGYLDVFKEAQLRTIMIERLSKVKSS